MNCDEIKEILSGYVDGEARGDDGRVAEEHLAACARCRDLVRRMTIVSAAIDRTGAVVPPGFRDAVFRRMEQEGLLPRRRGLLSYPLRWAAVPLAAAAVLAFFILLPRETAKVGPAVGTSPPTAAGRQAPDTGKRLAERGEEAARVQGAEEAARVARAGPEAGAPAGGTPGTSARAATDLTAEERDIVAHLEVFEDPAAFEEPSEVDDLEIVEPTARTKG